MLNVELLKQVLIISLSAGIITTGFVQKIKFLLPKKKFITFLSFISSMIFGTLFSVTFSNLSFLNSMWVGLITFIDADSIYKLFEGKIFKRYEEINKYIKIDREKDNVNVSS